MRVLYVCARILEPRNLDLGLLIFCVFWLVSILYLGLVEPSFHVFRSRVGRITCFTCLN